MADPEHVKWLLEGPKAWNARLVAWRAKHKGMLVMDFVADLAGADLQGIYLQSAELINVDLTGADLRDATLSWANLRGARLMGANLTGAQLMETTLEHADLSGANLNKANLWKADLRAKLSGASLREARLEFSDLRGAYLQKADLEFADIRGADLESADLKGAKLYKADARSQNSGTMTKNIRQLQLTDFSKVLNFKQKQLEEIIGDSGTILPKGMVRPAHWDKRTTGLKNEEAHEESGGATRPNSVTLAVKVRSLSEIRAALQASYPDATSLSAYLAEQLLREIAAHKMTSIPNEDEGLSDYNARLNMLNETLVAVRELHEAIPDKPPAEITNVEAKTLKAKLLELAKLVDAAINTLDQNTGTYGNLWKIGLIGACTTLLGTLGIPAAVAAAITGGAISVSTFRVIVEAKRKG